MTLSARSHGRVISPSFLCQGFVTGDFVRRPVDSLCGACQRSVNQEKLMHRTVTNDRKCFSCGSRTCKPNFVCGIAPAGRSFLWAAHYCAALATYPEV